VIQVITIGTHQCLSGHKNRATSVNIFLNISSVSSGYLFYSKYLHLIITLITNPPIKSGTFTCSSCFHIISLKFLYLTISYSIRKSLSNTLSRSLLRIAIRNGIQTFVNIFIKVKSKTLLCSSYNTFTHSKFKLVQVKYKSGT
jgi:hypothetical protein